MPQRGPRSRRSFFVIFSVVASLAASTSTARAADECIVKPKADPPQGQHWYYRTDRETKRQCWYLGPVGTAVRKRAEPQLNGAEPQSKPDEAVAPAAPAEGAANLSPQQREALFRRFVEWRRSHPAQHTQ